VIGAPRVGAPAITGAPSWSRDLRTRGPSVSARPPASSRLRFPLGRNVRLHDLWRLLLRQAGLRAGLRPRRSEAWRVANGRAGGPGGRRDRGERRPRGGAQAVHEDDPRTLHRAAHPRTESIPLCRLRRSAPAVSSARARQCAMPRGEGPHEGPVASREPRFIGRTIQPRWKSRSMGQPAAGLCQRWLRRLSTSNQASSGLRQLHPGDAGSR